MPGRTRGRGRSRSSVGGTLGPLNTRRIRASLGFTMDVELTRRTAIAAQFDLGFSQANVLSRSGHEPIIVEFDLGFNMQPVLSSTVYLSAVMDFGFTENASIYPVRFLWPDPMFFGFDQANALQRGLDLGAVSFNMGFNQTPPAIQRELQLSVEMEFGFGMNNPITRVTDLEVSFDFGFNQSSDLTVTPPYTMDLYEFDGTNRVKRGGGLTGAADNKTITFSLWLDPAYGGGQNMRYLTGTSALNGGVTAHQISGWVSATGAVGIYAENAAGTSILNVTTSAGVADAADGLVHVIGSIDLSNTSNRHLYVNGVADSGATWTTYVNDTIDWTLADWAIGAFPDGLQPYGGEIGDMWVNNSYMDLSNVTNLRKFISAAGQPVDLGTNGEVPTGSSPLIFMSGTGWATNKGSGGGFTETIYSQTAMAFDGTNVYKRGADLTGISNNKFLTFSGWFDPTIDGVQETFLRSYDASPGSNANVRLRAQRLSSNNFGIAAENAAGTVILNFSTSANTMEAADGKVHVAFSCDLSDTGKRHVYINGVLDSGVTWTTYTNDTIQHQAGEWTLGGTETLDELEFIGNMYDVWFDNSYIDLTVADNLRRFINASGLPPYLGTTGQAVTGSSPKLFLSGSPTNLGTGGGFTEVDLDAFVPFTSTYNSGSGNEVVPAGYTQLEVELWGGGAGGQGSANTARTAGTPGGATTCSTLSLTANGGTCASDAPGSASTGGTASGGDTNTTGGTSGSGSAGGASCSGVGWGGSSPNGGAQVAASCSAVIGFTANGNAGNAPGGGGSGVTQVINSAGANVRQSAGGSGGGYTKKTILATDPGAPTPGSNLAYSVGAGGPGGDSTLDGGAGANGRVRFTWT